MLETIKSKIHTIRGKQVMLDRDLAELYEVSTKALNQAVKRNKERFPSSFCFQLNQIEFENWKSQFVTSNSDKMGLRRPPFAFTEHGVSMLSSVLKSKKAIQVSIQIIESFVEMKHFLNENAHIFTKFQQIDQKLLTHDNNFNEIFQAMETKQLTKKQGIFFENSFYDAHKLLLKLINKGKTEIIIIDNYIDETILELFEDSNINVKIYSKNISKKLIALKDKLNNQNKTKIELIEFNKSHDRYLIIDKTELYHFGASLKDLGKKWFSFQKLDLINDVLNKL